MNISLVFGTRPEAIKIAPVIRELARRRVRHCVIATAQHRGMLDQTLRHFGIRPDYDLDIMRKNQDLFHTTTRVLEKLKNVFDKERPDVVLVQGDTTTTLAASLAAYYLGIPVGHIEAGLRTNDKHNPFPEEINRRLTSHIADHHFAPTLGAKRNLMREGIPKTSIHITGNTAIDALMMTTQKLIPHPNELRRVNFKKRVILLTAHRRENFGAPLRDIFIACKAIVKNNPDVEILYPVHPNPQVVGSARKVLGNTGRIHLVPPLSYSSMVYAMAQSYFVLTDSGGLQEEAPTLGKPVLVLRKTTERPEAIACGAARLVGTDAHRISREAQKLITDDRAYAAMSSKKNPFGDGRAAERIVNALLRSHG